MDDAALLAFAADQSRLLVSHDVRTLPAHFAALLADGQHSAGVILIPWHVGQREAIEALSFIWQVSIAEEWMDVLDYLPWR
jgi:hypothetical protein